MHLVAGGGPFSFDDGIDLAIRRDDFARPPGVHAEVWFAERNGPVCRPDKAAGWFTANGLRRHAPRLHTHTRPDAWPTRAQLAGERPAAGVEQVFDHFYFSLQAAVAGLGVAIGPWQQVRDDLASGVLVAPLGFIEDGTRYCLLAPSPPEPGGVPAALLAWLRTHAAEAR